MIEVVTYSEFKFNVMEVLNLPMQQRVLAREGHSSRYSPQKLSEIIFSYLLLWPWPLEVMTTFRTGSETKGINATIQGLHLYGRMTEYFCNATIVQTNILSLPTEFIGT
jgi:hypothetical protein